MPPWTRSVRCVIWIAAAALLPAGASAGRSEERLGGGAAAAAVPERDPVGAVRGEPLPVPAIRTARIVHWHEVEARAAEMADAAAGGVSLDDPDLAIEPGVWQVPKPRTLRDAASGTLYLANRLGDLSMSFSFAAASRFVGLAVAGQSGTGAWPPAVRIVAERAGVEVAATDWIAIDGAVWRRIDVADDPGFAAVDRVRIEARPGAFGLAWYGIDDLVIEGPDGVRRTVDFEDLAPGRRLADAIHAGIRFERGRGIRGAGGPMPPPVEPPAEAEADADAVEAEAEAAAPGTPLAGFVEPPAIEFQLETVRRGDAGLSFFPPDSCGAVGRDQIVTVVNQVIAIHDKQTGQLRSRVPLSAFLGLGAGDPRVLYDHHAGRWVVLATNFDTLISIAYSLGEDPTLAWFTTAFSISEGADANRSPDYPTLGVDARGIYLGATMFGTTTRTTLVAIDKAPLLEPSPSLGTITAFRNLTQVGALQPCLVHHEPGGDPGVQYLVSRRTSTALEIWQLAPPLSNPVLSSLGFVAIPTHADPPDIPTLGSSTPIDTVGPRLMNAVYRDGSVFAAHAIGLGSRSGVRWYEVDVATRTATSATVSDPVRSYYFPSISVNRVGAVALGFSGSSSSEFVGAYLTGRGPDDPGTEVAIPIRYRDGVAAINTIDQFGRNRWGDYSLTVTDPDDDLAFWTFQAFAGAQNTWAVEAANLRIGASLAPANDDCADAAVAGSGTTAFTTLFATTDGFDEAVSCSPGGVPDLRADVWFRWTAPCTGIASFAACDADFDVKLAVYAACPEGPGEALGCNDDFCGDGATVFLPVVAGESFLVRLGSRSGATGAGGLAIECTGEFPTCPTDVDGDGETGFPDLVELLAAWGPCGGACPTDIDGDGQTGFLDLVELLAAWGPCPG